MTAFADTNVFVYAADDADPRKHAAATALLASSPRPVSSPQVLREFFDVATRKLGIDPVDAERAVDALADSVAVVEDVALVLAAVRASRRWQVSLWDALIVEAARRAGCDELLSEDLQAGMDFDGVVVRNPFA